MTHRPTATRLVVGVALCSSIVLAEGRGVALRVAPLGDAPPSGFLVRERLDADPVARPDLVVAGAALDCVIWEADRPAFPGDAPGSLVAAIDSSAPAALYGFALPRPLDHTDAFTAAAVLVIESEGFEIGEFQISWGLWNRERTGLDRTGSGASMADTSEVLEMNWFPAISEFGGPFLTGALFGAAVPDHAWGAFGNFTSAFGFEATLPLDVPLLAVLEHRPEADALVLSVGRVLPDGSVLPVGQAVTVTPLDFLTRRKYELDAVGLTLWHDGLDGTPTLASLRVHAFLVRTGRAGDVQALVDALD